MVMLFGTGVPGEVVNGGYTNITSPGVWGVGDGGCPLTARISLGRASSNPAVTLPLAMFRGFRGGQGCAVHDRPDGRGVSGRELHILVLPAGISEADPALLKTAGVFTTFPAFPNLPMTGLYDQILGTFLLVLLIFGISDENRNLHSPASNLSPVLVGLIVVVIGMTFGSLHGYAINPARDFGPRVFTVVAGFRNNGLTDGTAVFLVPIAGPLVGGVIGAVAYDRLIGRHLEAKL